MRITSCGLSPGKVVLEEHSTSSKSLSVEVAVAVKTPIVTIRNTFLLQFHPLEFEEVLHNNNYIETTYYMDISMCVCEIVHQRENEKEELSTVASEDDGSFCNLHQFCEC